MSKDRIKIRKRWLIDPSTKVEPNKKREMQEEEDDNFRQYLGNTSSAEIEQMEEEDSDDWDDNEN